MTKKPVLKLFIVILFCSLSINTALALTATEEFLQELYLDKPKFPKSVVRCQTNGNLSKIFNRLEFTSDGSAFFYDKDATKRRMAIIESGSATSLDKKTVYDASILIRADDVTSKNLQDLIQSRKLVVTNQAKVVFALDVTQNKIKKTYLYEPNGEGITAKEKLEEPGDCTLYTRFTHVGNITSKGTKYIVVSGTIRIYFPKPPTILNGTPQEQITGDGDVTCIYKNLPLDDDYLPGIEGAFDGTLVNDIKDEAGLPRSPVP